MSGNTAPFLGEFVVARGHHSDLKHVIVQVPAPVRPQLRVETVYYLL